MRWTHGSALRRCPRQRGAGEVALEGQTAAWLPAAAVGRQAWARGGGGGSGNGGDGGSTDVADAFNSSQLWSTQGVGRPTGLFGYRQLHSADGFAAFTDQSIASAQTIVSRICGASSWEDSCRMVRDFDTLSDILCRVIDLATFICTVHPDAEMVKAALKAHNRMYTYMNQLNTQEELFKALDRVMNDTDLDTVLSLEERLVGKNLLADFYKSGIQLPKEQRRRFVTLSDDIGELGRQFVADLLPDGSRITFHPEDLRGLHPLYIKQLTLCGSKAHLPTSGAIAHLALQNVHSQSVRQKIYMALHTGSAEKVQILDELLYKRKELAVLVGCENYSVLTLKDKMTKNPDAVLQFLKYLADDNQQAVQKSLLLLEREKYSDVGSSTIYPWDRAFYSSRVRARLQKPFNISSPASTYLSVGTVMQGLSSIFQRLFGIRLVPKLPLPGETWHPSVRKLEVKKDNDEHIGTIYCDLFKRKGKQAQAAHFTIRCSRRIDDCALIYGDMFGGDGFGVVKSTDGFHYQLPIVALVCDFPPSDLLQGINVLTLQDVATLFHEMGHALHSMLGRTNLMNVAGTRCATDFVELPSLLMEQSAFCQQYVSIYARHYKTGEPLPYDYVRSVLELEQVFAALDHSDQIALAVLDQCMHSRPIELVNFNSTSLHHDVQRMWGVLPPTKGTSTQAEFQHVVGYGATYYAYLFDRAIVNKIWKEIFAKDPLSREAGETFYDEILRWGGSRDPWECVGSLLKDPKIAEGGLDAVRIVGSSCNIHRTD